MREEKCTKHIISLVKLYPASTNLERMKEKLARDLARPIPAPRH